MRVLAAATIAALFVSPSAPGASASHVEADCAFSTFSQQEITGPDVHQGYAYGYARAVGDPVAIRCAIYVNGHEVTSTPSGATTPHVAAVAALITFTASVEDYVTICSVVTTTTHGEQIFCPSPTTGPFPPQWVFDILDPALDTLGPTLTAAEAQLCLALGAQSPGTPPVTIDPTGDVYLDGNLVWDCPPYDWT